jgi:phosphodiesterase/alkaline phosphatase D-like protein
MAQDRAGSRRRFLKQSAALGGVTGLGGWASLLGAPRAPALVTSDTARPRGSHGLQVGDLLADRALVWSRADRPSRLVVEWSRQEDLARPVRVRGPQALPGTDLTARVELTGLPAGEEIFVRVMFQSLDSDRVLSAPVAGRFRTPPRRGRDVTEPAKLAVAQTLDEFRANYRYNRLDENLLRFSAEVPQVWQWDDHEVTNNWSDGKDLSGDARYTEKRIATLAGRARRAFLEHAPLRWHPRDESGRVYRHLPYGPDLDVFVLDMRSHRGPNTFNRQKTPGAETAFLGRRQLDWLKGRLERSRATWKVIAADMPLGLLIGDGVDAAGRPRFEGIANGDGPALGRELELADLLRFIKRHGVANVVWITADVHYCAAHHYDPARAVFQDFEPFWEFVAGPLNAGTFTAAAA